MERIRAGLGRQVRRLLLGTWGGYPWLYDMHAEGCMGLKTVKGGDIYHQNNIFSNSLSYDILVLKNKAIRGITEYSSAPYCHGTSRKGKCWCWTYCWPLKISHFQKGWDFKCHYFPLTSKLYDFSSCLEILKNAFIEDEYSIFIIDKVLTESRYELDYCVWEFTLYVIWL